MQQVAKLSVDHAVYSQMFLNPLIVSYSLKARYYFKFTIFLGGSKILVF